MEPDFFSDTWICQLQTDLNFLSKWGTIVEVDVKRIKRIQNRSTTRLTSSNCIQKHSERVFFVAFSQWFSTVFKLSRKFWVFRAGRGSRVGYHRLTPTWDAYKVYAHREFFLLVYCYFYLLSVLCGSSSTCDLFLYWMKKFNSLSLRIERDDSSFKHLCMAISFCVSWHFILFNFPSIDKYINSIKSEYFTKISFQRLFNFQKISSNSTRSISSSMLLLWIE